MAVQYYGISSYVVRFFTESVDFFNESTDFFTFLSGGVVRVRCAAVPDQAARRGQGIKKAAPLGAAPNLIY